jgi:hypothetical protein
MFATRLVAASAFVFAASAALAQTNVPLAHFDGVELRGGGHVIIRHGAVQRVTLLKGSTQFTTFSLRDSGRLVIDACNNDCPMRYDLEIEIVTPSITAVAIDGGGTIEGGPGFPAQRTMTAAVNGGGHVDLRNVPVRSATASVEGGGKIEIRAGASLTAAVNGGGSIRYVGNPAVTTAINGGGSVRPEGG